MIHYTFFLHGHHQWSWSACQSKKTWIYGKKGHPCLLFTDASPPLLVPSISLQSLWSTYSAFSWNSHTFLHLELSKFHAWSTYESVLWLPLILYSLESHKYMRGFFGWDKIRQFCQKLSNIFLHIQQAFLASHNLRQPWMVEPKHMLPKGSIWVNFWPCFTPPIVSSGLHVPWSLHKMSPWILASKAYLWKCPWLK